MNLKILTPSEVFSEKANVLRIVAETPEGSFGLLPHRRDCVAALSPGILVYETESEGEAYLALDEGVLIKTGQDVSVSTRRAQGGADLQQLIGLVESEFRVASEQEKSARSAMANIESRFLSRFVSLRNE
jgi:F-type H+-transporting ATPase subunit epsilon